MNHLLTCNSMCDIMNAISKGGFRYDKHLKETDKGTNPMPSASDTADHLHFSEPCCHILECVMGSEKLYWGFRDLRIAFPWRCHHSLEFDPFCEVSNRYVYARGTF